MKIATPVKPPLRRKTRAPRTLAAIARVLRPRLPALSKKYNFKSFGVFGSYARGAQKTTSDLDVLVEYYDRIDYKEIWKVLHESIPHDLPLVRAMFDAEKKRRHVKE